MVPLSVTDEEENPASTELEVSVLPQEVTPPKTKAKDKILNLILLFFIQKSPR